MNSLALQDTTAPSAEPILTFKGWESLPVGCGVTTRHLPVFMSSCGDMKNQEIQSRLSQHLSLPQRGIVSPKQIHSDRVVVVEERDLKAGVQFHFVPDADGLVTRVRELALSVLSADCLSLFFYVPSEVPYVGILHAGWRGTSSDAASKMVQTLHRESQCDPSRYRVLLGPSIGSCCYEVGKEFKQIFSHSLSFRNGKKWYFDLANANIRSLVKSTVPRQQITSMGLCTQCGADRFYSYRREKEKTGRMISYIYLR